MIYIKKLYTVLIILALVIALTIPASAACLKKDPKSCTTPKSCVNGKNCKSCKNCSNCTAGIATCKNCNVKGSCVTCDKSVSANCKNKVCISYMNCTGEYINIYNGRSVNQNLHNYKITISCKDCKTVTYKIPNITLKPVETLRVYTCTGNNSANAVYIGKCGDVIKCKGTKVKLNAACGKLIAVRNN